MDDVSERRLQALRGAVELLDKTEIPAPTSLVSLAQRAAAGALARARSIVRAVVVLAQTPGVGVAEVEVLVRVLLEMAITSAWIGCDEHRAAEYRDQGIWEARGWLREMDRLAAERGSPGLRAELRAQFDAYIAEGRPRKMPSIGERARNTAPRDRKGGWIELHQEYVYFYQRLCAPVHHDHRLHALIEPLVGGNALPFALHAAVVATGVLISAAWEPLGMTHLYAAGVDLVFNAP